jgi:hypothetical protein
MRPRNRPPLNQATTAAETAMFFLHSSEAESMKMTLSAVLLFAVCSGCSSTSLQQYTLNQSMTVSDMRYKQVMFDLAVIAENRGKLPSFALTGGGLANVTNTVSFDSATLWAEAVRGFSQDTLAASGQHNPELQWTLDPIVSEPQLEALGYAFMWAIYGPPPLGTRPREVLRALTLHDILYCPSEGETKRPPGYRFGVEEQLSKIPQGWVHQTDKYHIPKEAIYHAACGDTAVWVGKDDLGSLSEFTLVVLDIATIDPKSLIIPTPTVSVVVSKKMSSKPPEGPGASDATALPKVSGTPSMDETSSTASRSKHISNYNIKDATEKWNACQEINGETAGMITLSRPTVFGHNIFRPPALDVKSFSVESPGPTPLFTDWADLCSFLKARAKDASAPDSSPTPGVQPLNPPERPN